MRKYLLAAAAVAAIASPAAARDGSGYVGVEAGALWPQDTLLDVSPDFVVITGTDTYDNAAQVDYKTGWDADIIGGYDFGMFRVEGELGYKRASVDDIDLSNPFLDAVNGEFGIVPPLLNEDIDFDGHVSVLSGMINAMFDFEDGRWGGFAGGGIGLASVTAFDGHFDGGRRQHSNRCCWCWRWRAFSQRRNSRK